MTDSPPPPSSLPPAKPLPRLLLILAIVVALALAFAWTAGWLPGQRLTAQRMINAGETANGVFPGYRRAHSKGICVTGYFEPSAEAETLSLSRVFAQSRVPAQVMGRMSIGGADPHGADGKARVRSMALQLIGDDGQEWRMAMNSFPFFAVASTAAFQEQTIASIPDPATGKPDPAKLAAFAERHPEVKKFREWAATAPWPSSFADTTYYSVNSFRFRNAQGQDRWVRWRMQPETPFQEMSAEERSQASQDFLAADLEARLAKAPLRWQMVVSVAEPGDPINDPSQPWPEQRQQVVAGTLTLERAQDEANGDCRDINFDPLILPTGVAGSSDPILAARSAAYSESFNRRQRETAQQRRAQATGSQGEQP